MQSEQTTLPESFYAETSFPPMDYDSPNFTEELAARNQIIDAKHRAAQKDLIQGYVPAIRLKGRKTLVYVSFKGGFTPDYNKAHCLPNKGEAINIARAHCRSMFDLPYGIPVNGLAEIML